MRSPALTFLLFAVIVSGTFALLGFGFRMLDLYFISNMLGIASMIASPVMYLIALSRVYKFGNGVHGAGHAFVGALIFVGVNLVVSFLVALPSFIQYGGSFGGMFLGVFLMQLLINFAILLVALTIFSRWRLNRKAGRPGWAILVPVYNLIVECEIAMVPGWWVAMILLVPIAGIVFAIILTNRFVHAFGKDAGFTVGTIFLPLVFYPILALGDNPYQGNTATTVA